MCMHIELTLCVVLYALITYNPLFQFSVCFVLFMFYLVCMSLIWPCSHRTNPFRFISVVMYALITYNHCFLFSVCLVLFMFYSVYMSLIWPWSYKIHFLYVPINSQCICYIDCNGKIRRCQTQSIAPWNPVPLRFIPLPVKWNTGQFLLIAYMII